MGTTTRSFTAALLSLPLALSVAAPAMAEAPTKYKASGTFADAGGWIVGPVDGLQGNVHFFQLDARTSQEGTSGGGFIDSFACPDGITNPFPDDGSEELLCDPMAYFELQSESLTFTVNKKATAAGVNGTFALVGWDCDDETGECWPGEPVGTLAVDLELTATGGATVSRGTERFRDPETGQSYRVRWTQRTSFAAVSGTVGGADVSDAWGNLGTFRFRSMEKM